MANKNTVGAILAILALVALIAGAAALMFLPIPEGNRDLFNIALMAIVSCVSTAFGFFLGSSLGSSDKNALLSGKPSTPPDAPPVPGS